MNKWKFTTKAVHAGQHPDPSTGSIAVPIYETSTFVFENAEQGAARFAGTASGYIYTRLGNPTIRALEKNIAELENGEDARACASGMAAIHMAVTSVAKKGDHVISTDCLYGGTQKLFSDILPKFGIEFSFVDTSIVGNIEASIKENTKLIFIETPSNPTLKLTDLQATAKIAKEHGIKTAADNTFMSPYFQRPIEFGIDASIHSLTKYLNGHSDVVGGIIVANNTFIKTLDPLLKNTGATLGPFEAWLTLRGTKTLPLRMERHNENAMKVAQFLEKHPKVQRVYYPGLESHPQHELAKKQMSGFGGMISFDLKGGLEAGRKLMNSVKLCSLAVSLGAVETLIQHPASMTHAVVPKEERLKSGITDSLVRLSVGIEDVEDIIDDLEQAMEKI
ncbi:MAG TPA: PLP-dependent aspartate aminotransferase family protein [Candidatus Bathyarchaeia archaeon]|jgi:methionine-gamma-lyase|nr:PLP-dependent aspartate aminotransferase family protein [Candidatus Bathyarchaeia archaeon]